MTWMFFTDLEVSLEAKEKKTYENVCFPLFQDKHLGKKYEPRMHAMFLV
jgi:hypothetical protein